MEAEYMAAYYAATQEIVEIAKVSIMDNIYCSTYNVEYWVIAQIWAVTFRFSEEGVMLLGDWKLFYVFSWVTYAHDNLAGV